MEFQINTDQSNERKEKFKEKKHNPLVSAVTMGLVSTRVDMGAHRKFNSFEK